MTNSLAIADPPYLGRADRWYGDGRGSGRPISKGRKPDYHPDAAYWDHLESHLKLIEELDQQFDGWALAAHASRSHELLAHAPARARLCIWHRPNAMPGGARIVNRWEAVIVAPPADRIKAVKGLSVSDVLTEAVHPQGFLGSKPPRWTIWVLNMLGAQPGDCVEDIFPGSGAVKRVIDDYLKRPPLYEGKELF